MHPHCTLITLGTRDLPRAIRFYRDTIGWNTTANDDDPVAFFHLKNGVTLGLYPRTLLADDATVPEECGAFAGITLAHNLGSIAEVDACFADLRTRGVRIVKQPAQAPWGGYSGYMSDPDGYLWEIAWNPFWTLDANGTARDAA